MLAGSVWQKQPRYDDEERKSTAHSTEDDRENSRDNSQRFNKLWRVYEDKCGTEKMKNNKGW